MAASKPRGTSEEVEDMIIGKIFLVSITETNSDSRMYLETAAAEMIREGKKLRLSLDFMASLLVDRITAGFSQESMFQYLMGCYQRAHDEANNIDNIEDKTFRLLVEKVVTRASSLCIMYVKIHLANLEESSIEDLGSCVSPLLPLILAEVGGGGGIKSPPGFLKDIFSGWDIDSAFPVLEGLYNELRRNVTNSLALSNFKDSLNALLFLVSFPVGANSLVCHKQWIPESIDMNGRVFETNSFLGAFLRISALPDDALFHISAKDESREHGFATLSKTDWSSIKTVVNVLYDGLAGVLIILLQSSDTREKVLDYIEKVIKLNASIVDVMKFKPTTVASSGMLLNLSAVMLRLCEHFFDGTERLTIDPKYVYCSNRLHISGWSAHRISEEAEVKAEVIALSNDNSARDDKTKYSLICELFFLTARVLNMGLIKAIIDYELLVEDVPQCEDGVFDLEQDAINFYKKLCYEAQLLEDNKLIRSALSFYNLMIVWLLDLFGGSKMPLSPTFPMKFATMPQFFVEDAMDLLIFAFNIPEALEGVKLDDFMNFIVMFMACPQFIENPIMSAKMVKVLNCWMPSKSLSTTGTLFEGHQLSLEYLVRNILKLYVNFEFTGHPTEFDDIHHDIAELLEYLRQFPSHCNAWRQVAKEEEKGVYLNFLNFLIDNSIHLLDESLDRILNLKGHVRMLNFTAEHITAPFLLPEMVERVASMLNYFLLQLVGDQSILPSWEDPENESCAMDLLKQIVRVYVHLARADTKSVFAAAISKDGGSHQLFSAAAEALRRNGDDGSIILEFIGLGAKAKIVASIMHICHQEIINSV